MFQPILLDAPKRRKWDYNPQEQEAIRLMARLRLAGSSYKKIADELNRRGIRTKSGRSRWQCGNVAGVLNSSYTRERRTRSCRQWDSNWSVN